MLNKNELISDIKDKRKTCNYVWLIIIAALASADIIAWIYISINTKLSLPAFILFHIFSFAYIFFDLKLREKYYVNDIVSTIRFDLITSIALIIALILKYTLRSYYVFIGWAVSCVIFISSYFIQKKLFLDNPLLTNYIYFNNGQLTEKIYFDFNSFKFSSNPIEKEDENKIANLDVIDKTYTFCVNMADSCNLNCTYCFNKNKSGEMLSKEEVFDFLNTMFDTFKDGKKYYVDLSGKGEPLLNLPLIEDISNYCAKKEKEIGKDIVVRFVTNGVLLTKNVSDKLHELKILYGVSIDGVKKVHDELRNKTYDLVIENVDQIAHKEFVGAACTLTNEVFSLKESLVELAKHFKTISYKFDRSKSFLFDKEYLHKWIKSYKILRDFLLEEIKNDRFFYLEVLTRGDDTLGTYIRRIFLKTKVNNRCDASITRFCLNTDKIIYGCARDSSNPIEGNLEVIAKKEYFNQVEKCHNCPYKHICGGECSLVEKNYNRCLLKAKIISLALELYLSLTPEEREKVSTAIKR